MFLKIILGEQQQFALPSESAFLAFSFCSFSTGEWLMSAVYVATLTRHLVDTFFIVWFVTLLIVHLLLYFYFLLPTKDSVFLGLESPSCQKELWRFFYPGPAEPTCLPPHHSFSAAAWYTTTWSYSHIYLSSCVVANSCNNSSCTVNLLCNLPRLSGFCTQPLDSRNKNVQMCRRITVQSKRKKSIQMKNWNKN